MVWFEFKQDMVHVYSQFVLVYGKSFGGCGKLEYNEINKLLINCLIIYRE